MFVRGARLVSCDSRARLFGPNGKQKKGKLTRESTPRRSITDWGDKPATQETNFGNANPTQKRVKFGEDPSKASDPHSTTKVYYDHEEKDRRDRATAAVATAASDWDTGGGEWGTDAKKGVYAPATSDPLQRSPKSPARRAGAPPQGKHGESLSLVRLRQKTREMSHDNTAAEFKQLPNALPDPKSLPHDGLELTRNARYFPFPKTRVRVEPTSNPNGSDYINASYVRGLDPNDHRAFIVTQAPMSGHHEGKLRTVEAFWHMVWHEHVRIAVMLEGSTAYWPDKKEGDEIQAGGIKLKMVSSGAEPFGP